MCLKEKEKKPRGDESKNVTTHELTFHDTQNSVCPEPLPLLSSPLEYFSPISEWFILSLLVISSLPPSLFTPLLCYFSHHTEWHLELYYFSVCCMFTRPWAPEGMDSACLLYSSASVPRTISGKKKKKAQGMNKWWMNEWVSKFLGRRYVCSSRHEIQWSPCHWLCSTPPLLCSAL